MPALWRLFETEAKTSILHEAYETKIARIAQVFGGIELMPSAQPVRQDRANYAAALTEALNRIEELEQTVWEQNEELKFYRPAQKQSKSSAA
jgi:hypothetical protein